MAGLTAENFLLQGNPNRGSEKSYGYIQLNIKKYSNNQVLYVMWGLRHYMWIIEYLTKKSHETSPKTIGLIIRSYIFNNSYPHI